MELDHAGAGEGHARRLELTEHGAGSARARIRASWRFRNPWTRILTVAVPFLCCIAARPSDSAAQAVPVRLRGTVKEGGLRLAIPGAEVRVLDGRGVQLARVESDADGTFAVPLESPGRVRVLVTAPQYRPLSVEETLPPRETLAVDYRLFRAGGPRYQST